MNDSKTPAKFEKGSRAAVVAGKKGVGVRGQVFWIGENKYGPGSRYGLRGDDGDTYWLDDTQIGPESAGQAAPPSQDKKPTASGPALDKGQRVVLKANQVRGEVFWVGQSRYGDGMRYGVRDNDGNAHWVDAHELDVDRSEAAAMPASARVASTRGGTEPGLSRDLGDPGDWVGDTPLGPEDGLMGDPGEAVPLPNDADLPPEAFADYAAADGAEAFWEPTPGDDSA
jgi:hypothetical protein